MSRFTLAMSSPLAGEGVGIKLRWFFCGIVLCGCCLAGQPVRAEVADHPCTKGPTNGTSIVVKNRDGWYASAPIDVALRLTLRDGKSAYHEGEIIPLELSFTASAKGKYAVDTRSYDRSGRLNLESFCVDPDKGRDPLEDYYDSGLFDGFVAGGIGQEQVLGQIPYLINEELNEWRSLPPGSYRLQVASDRVAQIARGATGLGEGPVLVLSNTVTFQVIAATPEWQAEQLSHAISMLDEQHPRLTQSEFEQLEHAARVLRFLGSEAATRELARRFWSHDRPAGSPHIPGVGYPVSEFYQSQLGRSYWDFKAGLIASPHRVVAIEELISAIDNPLRPATRNMAETLALLEIQSKPEYKLPLRDSIGGDEWLKQRQAKVAAYNKIVETLGKRVTSTR